MQIFKRHKQFILFGLLVFLLGVFSLKIEWLIASVNRGLVLNSFEKAILETEQKSLELLDSLSFKTLEENQKAYNRLEKKYASHSISFYVYEQDSLKLWSNIEALPPFYFKEFYRPTYHKTENGSYLFFVRSQEKQHWVVAILLGHHYQFSNKYLQENTPLLPQLSKYYTVTKPGLNNIAIQLASGQEVCSLHEKELKTNGTFMGIVVFALLVLGVFFIKKPTFFSLIFICSIYLLLRALGTSIALNNIELYQPSLYAGALWGINLGDLFFSSLILLKSISLFQGTKNKPFLAYFLAFLTGLVVLDLENNSVIVIDTLDILNLSAWSFLVFALISFFVHRTLFVLNQDFGKADIISFGFIGFIGLLLSIIGHFTLLVLLFPALIFIAKALAYYLKLGLQNTQLGVSILLIAALFVFIEIEVAKTEKSQLPIVVKNLVNQRDNVAEFLLADFRENLTKDAYIKSFFTNPFLPKSAIEGRLEKLYLRGYLKKFEHKILFLPKKVKFGYVPDLELAENINNIINYQSNRVSDGVYSTKLVGITNAYLTEQFFTQGADTIGSLYVLLSEKTFYDKSIYPELLVGKEVKNPHDKFHYALYKDKKLVSSTGDLSYPLFISAENDVYKRALTPHFIHYEYQADQNTLFILSAPKRGSLSYISSFSVFLFIIVLLLLLQFYFSKGLGVLLRFKQIVPQTTLSDKIRFATIGSVFVALLILAYATGVYTQKKYEAESEETLLRKTKKAYLFFSNTFSQNKNFKKENDILQEQVLQFSELYEVDIDIFDANGALLASSQKLLYENGILENQIDGSAYHEIKINGKSQVVKSESVGLLEYQSSFTPIVVNNHIKGYIHLPYFTRQQDLRKEQASFFVTLFNIYLILLLLLGLLTAFIARNLTRPLHLITQQIKKTTLTSNNEKIHWQKQDEIGLLVNEYNEMVDKLEKSAKQLAENKQAEAWQEMARQVAHEIKNPLTPMKLNIQQLQRAWKDQHQNLEKIFEKVTSILISQIDILSKIASEFSSFSKMPDLKLEKFNLIDIFSDIEKLYNHDSQIVTTTNNEGSIVLNGDKDQLFRAFNNIVKNGIQAVDNERKPRINIKLEHPEGMDKVYIYISDNGHGIEESKKDKIFIPNFSTKSSGMGLGLAIVKQIIENHNGQIGYETNINTGTTFKIELPFYNLF